MSPVHLQQEIRSKLDEFLDVYSFYLKTRISLIRDEARLRAYELQLLDRNQFARERVRFLDL
ncbi:MAG TPA: hypothetical protein P5561_00950 [Candidatus Omnitrophota bacterium]|nr:hypothetical protein [Candidatus Omnitrophota bacterium]HRY85080.1 hypothetical protein [Candidatus Omnitrophota bacterium]